MLSDLQFCFCLNIVALHGKREIAEINAQMTGTFYTEEDLNH